VREGQNLVNVTATLDGNNAAVVFQDTNSNEILLEIALRVVEEANAVGKATAN
jgi:acyl-CoA reductase-like NAD-dependent aldehyde dehydrogenase